MTALFWIALAITSVVLVGAGQAVWWVWDRRDRRAASVIAPRQDLGPLILQTEELLVLAEALNRQPPALWTEDAGIPSAGWARQIAACHRALVAWPTPRLTAALTARRAQLWRAWAATLPEADRAALLGRRERGGAS